MSETFSLYWELDNGHAGSKEFRSLPAAEAHQNTMWSMSDLAQEAGMKVKGFAPPALVYTNIRDAAGELLDKRRRG